MIRDGGHDDERDEPNGATELDVDLPKKIALAHEDGELEERETLPMVQLPQRDALEGKVAPVLSPMPEADRSTEMVGLPRFEEVKAPKRGMSPALLVLLGLVIGVAVTLLIVFLIW